jgi:outer membrane protein assembly factor BamB
VPLVHGSRVYVFGAAGDLHCLELADGRKVWSRDTHADFKAQEGYFGAGSTPIVAADKLLVNVGGRSAGIVAFELATGKTAWQTTAEQASYSSPTMALVNQVPHAIFLTRLQCLALDPRNGQIAFSFPFGATGPTVNAATPLVFDGRLFISASYMDTPPREIWANDESMSSQYATCVYHDGHLFGFHGREDYQSGELRCIEALTGKVKWTTNLPLTGSVVLVQDRLLILSSDGQLLQVAARHDQFVELARATVSRHTTRALPAFSQGCFYFRDNADTSTGQLYCLRMAEGR